MARRWMRVGFLFSEERFNFIRSLKKEFNISSTDIFSMGFRYMLGMKKDIINKIYLKDHVPLYKGNKYPHRVKLRPTRKDAYKEIFVYRIEQITDKRVRLFYKENDNTEDLHFLVTSVKKSVVDEEVYDLFPMDLWEQIPGE